MFDTLANIGKIITPVTSLIDDLHTSDEEKEKLKFEMMKAEMAAKMKIMETEFKYYEKQAEIIKTEAKSESWLTRSFRPITCLTFTALVVLNSIGVLVVPIADEMWLLIQLSLTGYIGGRSLEKVTPKIMDKIKDNKTINM